MNNTLELTQALISRPSVTPDDAGCQNLIAVQLKEAGFTIEHLPFDSVSNLWACHGNGSPVLVFAGHTDVVPTGPLEQWSSPPFQPTIRDGKLYGRGAADMKSGVAAMVIAAKNFVKNFPNHVGCLALLLTSDEEGPSTHGTKKVIEHLQARKQSLDYCVMGEPSSSKCLGDTIKIGRRGSLTGALTIHGKQGHIAYPQLADNPIHRSINILKELCNMQWDRGNDYFPPTSFQIANIHGGIPGISNVIPGSLEVLFNFRYSPEVTAAQLQQRVEQLLQQQQCRYQLQWRHGGEPFLTKPGKLTQATQQAIQTVTPIQQPEFSTAGGTSDGRFIAPTGCEVIEVGVCNESIHQVDEYVHIEELEQLTDIYYKIMVNVLL